MVYTIRIKDESRKAKSIINMLKALQEDYDFMEISEEVDVLNEDLIMKELEDRYNSYLKERKGKEWKSFLNEF